MENIEPGNAIQFLDLTGVDEQERNWLLSSLFSVNEKIKLPWTSHPQTHINQPRIELTNTNNFQNINQKVSGILTSAPGLILNTNINVGGDNNPTKELQTVNYPISQPYCTVFTQPINNTVHLGSEYYEQQKPNLQYGGNYGVPVQPSQDHYSQHIPNNPSNLVTHTVVVNSNINYNSKGYINTKLEITQGFAKPSQEVDLQIESVNNQNQVDKTLEVSPQSQAAASVSSNTQPAKDGVKNEKEKVSTPVNSWASLFNKPKTAETIVKSPANTETEKPLAFVQPFKQVPNVDIAKNLKEPFKSNFDDPHLHRMGEFFFGYTIDNQTISLQPRGLINRSNYCYINSILQALTACPPLYNLLYGLSQKVSVPIERNKITPVIDNMVKFIKEFNHLPANMRVNRRIDKNNKKKEQNVMINYDSPIEPTYIYKMLNGRRTDTFLVEGRQEDAEEFLGCLLNGLNDEMLELIKMVDDGSTTIKEESLVPEVNGHDGDKEWQVMGPKNKGSITRRTEFTQTPISNIFGGLLRSRIHRTGDQSTDNIQPFFTLPLNIEKATTVREALEILISKNQLEGVTSSRTNQEVEAWQQVTLEELPVVLILHLKCFDYKLDGCSKIIKALEFPVDLKIDSKLLSSKTNYSAKEKQYKLFAVVYHDGKEATKGHYVTDAYHIGYASWLRYDDSSVKAVQEEHVLKPHGTRVPYLLFYRRSDSVRSK